MQKLTQKSSEALPEKSIFSKASAQKAKIIKESAEKTKA